MAEYQNTTVTLMDLQGKPLTALNPVSPLSQMNLTDLPAGIYLLIIERTGMILFRERIIKIPG